jgi:hypothetical protein
MTILTPPGWLQNAGSVHTAAQLRQYLSGLIAGTSGSATVLRARSGVHPALGGQLEVTQTGSPSMGVLVNSGVATIAGSESTSQGNYWVANDASVTLAISAAHGSLARIDLVVANVRDTFYSGVNNDTQLRVVTGTPAASPAVPSEGANAIILAQIAVGAGVTTIVDGNITDRRAYLAATGGIIQCINDAARPASTDIAVNQVVSTLSSNELFIWNGSAYRKIWPVNGSDSAFDWYTGDADSDLTLTTSYADITGASVSFDTYYPDAIYEVWAVWDAEATTVSGVTAIRGEMMIDGVADLAKSAFTGLTTGARATVMQVYDGTISTPGAHTIKLRALKSANVGTYKVLLDATKLLVNIHEQ